MHFVSLPDQLVILARIPKEPSKKNADPSALAHVSQRTWQRAGLFVIAMTGFAGPYRSA